MSECLLVFDRQTGRGRVIQFDDGQDDRVLRARRIAEALAGPDEEVMTLRSDSEDALRVTHSRS
jgi:hypothetical protein